VCGVQLPLAQLVHLSYAVQVKFGYFNRNLEAFDKLTTRLTDALFQGCFKNLVIWSLWVSTVVFITQGQICLPESLEPMPVRCPCVHSQHYPQRMDLFSDLTGQLKVKKLSKTNELLRHLHVYTPLLQL